MAKLKPNQFEYRPGMVITERPILCQTDMVQAILEDRKTQTRRGFHQASYLTNETQSFRGMGFINGREDQYAAAIGTENFRTIHKSKYGKPGDLLWVRETWAPLGEKPNHNWMYKSDVSQHYSKWKPSIHMPKDASRIWLMIEEIRVERVQDISEEDAIAEGIQRIDQHGVEVWRRYDDKNTVTMSPMISFWSLWSSINGEESWDSNPWVWVIKFRVLSKTGRPSLQEIERNYFEVTGKEVTNG